MKIGDKVIVWNGMFTKFGIGNIARIGGEFYTDGIKVFHCDFGTSWYSKDNLILFGE